MNDTRREIVEELARKYKRTFTAIIAVIETQDKAIVDTILNDDVYLNVKLDYLGTFETLPYRRKMVTEAAERNRLKAKEEGKDEVIRGSRMENISNGRD